jgi:hypothetical protein
MESEFQQRGYISQSAKPPLPTPDILGNTAAIWSSSLTLTII